MKTKNVKARGGFKIHAIAVDASNAMTSETALCGQTSIKRGVYVRGSGARVTVWYVISDQSKAAINCTGCRKKLGLK